MTERQKVQHKETSYNNFQGKTGRGEKESKRKISFCFFSRTQQFWAAAEQQLSREQAHSTAERDREKIFSISLSRSP